ncbi:hypothetical protein ACFOWZ_41090 [Lentzea rhizosphaerae]|uniref:Short chain dehydrogenase n=1 Tax=Lentzea rhizosphaerae TaxID=2041025 RepID=A0ABV8C7A9_9PSEU
MALVTGGGSGIGRGAAELPADRGARLAVDGGMDASRLRPRG